MLFGSGTSLERELTLNEDRYDSFFVFRFLRMNFKVVWVELGSGLKWCVGGTRVWTDLCVVVSGRLGQGRVRVC